LWVEDREQVSSKDGLATSRSRGHGAALEAEGDEVIRGFVRNLKTGQERYVSDPDQLGRKLFQDLALEAEEELPAERDLESGLA